MGNQCIFNPIIIFPGNWILQDKHTQRYYLSPTICGVRSIWNDIIFFCFFLPWLKHARADQQKLQKHTVSQVVNTDYKKQWNFATFYLQLELINDFIFFFLYKPITSRILRPHLSSLSLSLTLSISAFSLICSWCLQRLWVINQAVQRVPWMLVWDFLLRLQVVTTYPIMFFSNLPLEREPEPVCL